MLILILLAIISQFNCLYLQPKIESLYHNDKQLETLIDQILTQDKSIIIKKETCKNDNSYKSILIIPNHVPKQKVLSAIIICNIHARQLITSQICLQFIRKIKTLSQKSNSSDKSDLNTLPPNIQYRIFYRANNQRDDAIYKDHCIRKNKNGVDENRNFPTQFNIQKSPPDSQIYSGQKAIDQPFTECLESYIQQSKPDIFIDIHSGEVAFYYQQIQNQQSNEIEILNKIVKPNGLCSNCRLATLHGDNENINGHIFADLKVRLKVKYSMLFQVFGGVQDNSLTQPQNCFIFFNPKNMKQLRETKQKWVNIILQTMHLIRKRQDQIKTNHRHI